MDAGYSLGAGWESVEKALHDWLHQQTGVVVRWRRPGVPMPGTPDGQSVDFGLLSVVGFYPQGMTPIVTVREDTTRPPDSTLLVSRRRPGTLVLTVDLVTLQLDGNESAFPRLCAAAAALDSPSVFYALLAAGLGVQSRGDVRSLPGLIGIADHGRATLELRLNVGEERREWMGAVAGASVTRLT